MLLKSAVQRIVKWQVVLVCGILTLAFMLFFSHADRAAPEGTPGIIHLELAFSERKFSSIIDQWLEADTLQLQQRNLWIDLFFPIAYAVFLSSLLAWLAIRPDAEPSPRLIILFMLPFLAGFFDWIENALLLFLLRDTGNFSQPLIFLASIAASIKWILILVCALATIYYIFRKVVRLVR